MKVHCLFEQSGTFKNEFIKLGHEAYDYDIQNDFGQTDYEVDLFSEIRGGVQRKAEYLRQHIERGFNTCLFSVYSLSGEQRNTSAR